MIYWILIVGNTLIGTIRIPHNFVNQKDCLADAQEWTKYDSISSWAVCVEKKARGGQ